jgi:hypothetical protein
MKLSLVIRGVATLGLLWFGLTNLTAQSGSGSYGYCWNNSYSEWYSGGCLTTCTGFNCPNGMTCKICVNVPKVTPPPAGCYGGTLSCN